MVRFSLRRLYRYNVFMVLRMRLRLKLRLRLMIEIHRYIESSVPQVSDELQVAGIEKDMITTERGEYWRLLMPGTYHIRSKKLVLRFSMYLIHIYCTVSDAVELDLQFSSKILTLRRGCTKIDSK